MTRFGQAQKSLYGQIDKVAEGEWEVYSMTSSRKKYIVKEDGSCTCPDFKFRGGQCKHALSVELRYSVVQEVRL